MRITIEFDHGEEYEARRALNADKYLAALVAFASYLRSQVKYVEPENREDIYALRDSFYAILAREGVELE